MHDKHLRSNKRKPKKTMHKSKKSEETNKKGQNGDLGEQFNDDRPVDISVVDQDDSGFSSDFESFSYSTSPSVGAGSLKFSSNWETDSDSDIAALEEAEPCDGVRFRNGADGENVTIVVLLCSIIVLIMISFGKFASWVMAVAQAPLKGRERTSQD